MIVDHDRTMILIYLIPGNILVTKFASLMGSGFYIISIILIVAGFGWALINVNSLPMAVDMTDDERIGTYTGLYYFFSQLAATIGPVLFGWSIQLAGNNYRLMMVIAPIFFFLAFLTMLGVKKGEAKPVSVPESEV